MANAQWDFSGSGTTCRSCERVIKVEEHFYSVLAEDGEELVRHDICADCWSSPEGHAGAIAFWQTRKQLKTERRRKYAKIDIDLAWEIFSSMNETGGEKGESELRYVLALILLRRRVLKMTASRSGSLSFKDKNNKVYILKDPQLSEDRITALTERLGELLWDRAFSSMDA